MSQQAEVRYLARETAKLLQDACKARLVILVVVDSAGERLVVLGGDQDKNRQCPSCVLQAVAEELHMAMEAEALGPGQEHEFVEEKFH